MNRRHIDRLRLERLESRVAPAFLSFRAGDGYTPSDDTFVAYNLPQSPQATANQLHVAGAVSPTGARQSLIRFPNLFGPGQHQIPLNATIKAATITLWALSANDVSVPVRIHTGLTSWNGSVTWDGFGDGLQADGIELEVVPAVLQSMTAQGYQISSQSLVANLRAWQLGLANNGWAILPSTALTEWTFASGEDPEPTHRPMLTVEFAPVGAQNPSYAELAGQPPSPLKAAWFDWADDLRQRRLDRVPSIRTSTFYFAQDGDDLFGRGTIDSPWKSLAKAQQILDSQPIDARLRFRRGDVWRESTALQSYSDGLTIDDYGDGNLAKPLFTRFETVPSNSWAFVSNGVYSLSGMSSVGWLRESTDGFLHVYYRAASRNEVASRPYSWWFDDVAVDPISNGVPTLFVNAYGNPNTVPGGLEYCPGDAMGWYVTGDNVRMQNLRLEGQGMASDGFGYGLQIVHREPTWEFVGQNLEVYYTGYHSIGQIGQYANTRSVVTLVDCKAGYCTNRFGNGAPRSGDVTVFVSYADWGGNEYYQYDCEVVSGALPSSDWAAQPGMAHGQGLYTHVGQGGYMPLLLAWKTKVGQSSNSVAVLNNLDSGVPTGELNESRAYVVEDEPGPIASFWQKFGAVSINNILDLQNPPTGYSVVQTAMYYGPFVVGGWLINCTAKIDARFQFGGFYQFIHAGIDYTNYINCQLDISNSISPTYFRNPYLNSANTAFGMTLTNSIVSIQSTGETGINAVNDNQHLSHNAYFLSNLSANPALQYSGDTWAVTMPQRLAAGVSPTPSSPLYDGGIANGLEYDQRRQLRGVRRTIGPLAGAALPAPTQVGIGYGELVKTLGFDTVVPSHKTNRIVLTFPSHVDVQQNSLRLYSETGHVQLSTLVYDPITHIGTWELAGPLPRGRYILELDAQPLKSFRVLPGDIDGDGAVAASDFILFRLNFGSLSFVGDFDGNGSNDAADFILFRQMFGSSI